MKYLIIALLLSTTAFALTPLPSATPGQYVYDFGNVLSNSAALNSELGSYEQNTTIEIALVTLDSVPSDYTLFDYGVQLFDQWGIGKKSEDNGILVLIVKNGTVGNRMRIELGYGIQGYITGAESGRILDAAMPFYQSGNYDMTVRIIIDGLKSQLTNYIPGQQNREAGWDILYLILSNFSFVIFLIFLIISIAMRNRCPYCIRGKLKNVGDHYVCQRCGKKVTKRGRYAPIWVGGSGGGGFGGGGFGGGGFGGGGSGGGGAGR